MNEIEKLYENAGLVRKCPECDNNIDCDFGKDCYIPFTVEKQLALLRLLIRHLETELYSRYTNIKYKLPIYTEDCCISSMSSFGDILASVVCNVWCLLSDQEKKQVKEILQ